MRSEGRGWEEVGVRKRGFGKRNEKVPSQGYRSRNATASFYPLLHSIISNAPDVSLS
jgi:hypothetical protein